MHEYSSMHRTHRLSTSSHGQRPPSPTPTCNTNNNTSNTNTELVMLDCQQNPLRKEMWPLLTPSMQFARSPRCPRWKQWQLVSLTWPRQEPFLIWAAASAAVLVLPSSRLPRWLQQLPGIISDLSSRRMVSPCADH